MGTRRRIGRIDLECIRPRSAGITDGAEGVLTAEDGRNADATVANTEGDLVRSRSARVRRSGSVPKLVA